MKTYLIDDFFMIYIYVCGVAIKGCSHDTHCICTLNTPQSNNHNELQLMKDFCDCFAIIKCLIKYCGHFEQDNRKIFLISPG